MDRDSVVGATGVLVSQLSGAILKLLFPCTFFLFLICVVIFQLCVCVCVLNFFYFYCEVVGFWIFCGTFLCYNTCFYGLLLFKGYLNSQLAEIYITSTV